MTVDTILSVLENRPTDVITVFLGRSVNEDSLLESLSDVRDSYLFTEIQTVQTGNESLQLILSFE